jgi:dephospho-CoA kinase
MIKVVGLTGGIGSGKSVVASIIRAQNIPVIDADHIARLVVEPGQPAHANIAEAWPDAIAQDGHVDRKRLAAIVFEDEASRLRLEAITHPRIRERIDAEIAALATAGHTLAFVEAALLVETGSHERYDGLVVVTASEERQVERVVARDGCSREAALARLRAQLPLQDKVRAADHVIDNDGDLDATRAQTLRMLALFMRDS